MVGMLKVGDQIRQTHIRYRNMDDFETYNNAIDQEYEPEHSIFNIYIYKIDTREFNLVNKSQYGNGGDFKLENIEFRDKIYFIPSEGYCFVKCIKYLTGQEYKRHYLDFIRNEKRRSNIATKARIQPFCKANNINLEYWDGERIFPSSVTNRDSGLFFSIITFVQYGNHKVLVLIKLLKNWKLILKWLLII